MQTIAAASAASEQGGTSAAALPASASASAADFASMIRPVTPDALVNGFVTLVSVMAGSMLAYALQRRLQKSVEHSNAHTAAHRLMFALLQQINTVVLIQRDYIFSQLDNPGRFISIPATAPYDAFKNTLQIPELAFLIDTKEGRTILYEFYLAQENYIEAIKQWNLRSSFHLERVQPALASSTIPNNGTISFEALKLVLGVHVFGIIVNSTDNCVAALQRAFQRLVEVKSKVRPYLVRRFGSDDFTDFDFPETFGLVPAEKPKDV